MGSGELKGKESTQFEAGLFTEFSSDSAGVFSQISDSLFSRNNPLRRAFSLSAAVHLLIALLLFIPTMFGPSSEVRGNREVLAKAAAGLAEELPGEKEGFRFSPEDIPSDLAPFLSLETRGSGLLDREKFQLFKKLLQTYLMQNKKQTSREETVSPDEMLSLFGNEGKLNLDTGKQAFAFPSSSGPGIQVKTIDPGQQKEIDYLLRAKATKSDFFIEGQQVRIKTDQGVWIVPAGYFFRSCPYDEMIALGPSLFHVFDGFPSFPGSAPVEAINLKEEKTSGHISSRPMTMPVRVVSSAPGEAIPGGAEILLPHAAGSSSLDEGKQQQILDDLMVFREKEQLDRFFKIHLQDMDPNSEAAAVFVRRFIYENLSNVFLFISDISAAFDYLEELYYNRELKQTLLGLLQTYLDTRVGTEILLYFAAQYSFERRTLEHLFKSYPEAKKSLKQKYFKAEIHEKKAKLYVITKIYEYLQKAFRGSGLNSQVEILNRYKSEEAEIYSLLIHRGAPEKYHGLFALGSLYWKNQQNELALSTWDLIPLDYPSKALMEIRDVISSTTKLERTFPMITAILNYHTNKNVRQHLARLVKFGKWGKRVIQ